MSNPNSNTPSIPVDHPGGSAPELSNTSRGSGDSSSYAIDRWFNEPKEDAPFDTIGMVQTGPSQSAVTGAGGGTHSSADATDGSSRKA
ncbi:uncharacterized protein PgNI_07273 [Pyricularia grisea]|uniref:Uncharacterized protein n=1 Tax=Pyricularia grisea TaxID=148305 RepID=A0A6P8B3U9_PYRGI|nr:uncharacterized protein PgNI_07273 [Pyricularia grisea]TLD09378.1 hypothetical protein PgNI_07273 [Pyricularia grisea]